MSVAPVARNDLGTGPCDAPERGDPYRCSAIVACLATAPGRARRLHDRRDRRRPGLHRPRREHVRHHSHPAVDLLPGRPGGVHGRGGARVSAPPGEHSRLAVPRDRFRLGCAGGSRGGRCVDLCSGAAEHRRVDGAVGSVVVAGRGSHLPARAHVSRRTAALGTVAVVRVVLHGFVRPRHDPARDRARTSDGTARHREPDRLSVAAAPVAAVRPHPDQLRRRRDVPGPALPTVGRPGPVADPVDRVRWHGPSRRRAPPARGHPVGVAHRGDRVSGACGADRHRLPT